ncbi:MAG: HD domain-containing protein [Eubacteriales bacterium]
MTKLEKAAEFAARFHAGQSRKLGGAPFLVHLYETVANAALVTDDEDVLAAAMLHDTLERTGVTTDMLREEFGEVVMRLVMWCSEDKGMEGPANETWQARKVAFLDRTKIAPREAKIILLAAKLSDMRSLAAYHNKYGDAVWEAFNNLDKYAHDWYHRTSLEEVLTELEDEFIYKEYARLIEEVFGGGFDL